jgi:hypothetical protein
VFQPFPACFASLVQETLSYFLDVLNYTTSDVCTQKAAELSVVMHGNL